MKLLSRLIQRSKSFFKILTFLKIDFSFFIVLCFAIVLKETKSFMMYIFFLLFHELTHYFVAKKLGYMAKNIKLSFFGASLEGLDDFSLKDEIKVIFAGPFFNFVIVVLCYLSFWFNPESYNYLYEVLVVNLSILLFNLLPIFPLDMGRLILVFFTRKYVRKRALKVTKTISFGFVIVMFIVFLVSIFFEYNFMLGFVCVNLMNLLISSSKNTSFRREIFVFHKAKLLSKGLIERNIYLSKNVQLYSLFKYIDDYHFINFMFVDSDFEVVNTMSETEFYKKTGFFN